MTSAFGVWRLSRVDWNLMEPFVRYITSFWINDDRLGLKTKQASANFPSMWADLFLTMTFPPAGQRSSWPNLRWRYKFLWMELESQVASLALVFTTNLLCWRQRIGSASFHSQRIGTWAHSYYNSSFPIHQSALIFAECLLLCARWISALLSSFQIGLAQLPFWIGLAQLTFFRKEYPTTYKVFDDLGDAFNLPLWACREFASDRGNLA